MRLKNCGSIKPRTRNALRGSGVETTDDLVRLTVSDLVRMRNFGRGSFADLARIWPALLTATNRARYRTP